jgi:hypothetical protein
MCVRVSVYGATLWHGKEFNIDAISDYVANIAFDNTVAALYGRF